MGCYWTNALGERGSTFGLQSLCHAKGNPLGMRLTGELWDQVKEWEGQASCECILTALLAVPRSQTQNKQPQCKYSSGQRQLGEMEIENKASYLN